MKLEEFMDAVQVPADVRGAIRQGLVHAEKRIGAEYLPARVVFGWDGDGCPVVMVDQVVIQNLRWSFGSGYEATWSFLWDLDNGLNGEPRSP